MSFVPGADQFPYYAPFGAIVATTFTLAGSVRESLQASGAIVVGGATALAVDTATRDLITPFTVGIVVALAVILAGWKRLGTMGGWVPTAALFTLIIGHGEAFFIGAYGGLTLFGAFIGILVNMLAPPVPLAPARTAVDHTRNSLAALLRDIGTLMVDHQLPTLDDWRHRHGALGESRALMRESVAQAHDALTANRRARHHREALAELTEEAESLERISLLVSDVADLVLRPHGVPGDDSSQTALRDDLREPIARSMHSLADALDAVRGEDDTGPPVVAADAELTSLLAHQPSDTSEQLLLHSIVLALRRALDAFA